LYGSPFLITKKVNFILIDAIQTQLGFELSFNPNHFAAQEEGQ